MRRRRVKLEVASESLRIKDAGAHVCLFGAGAIVGAMDAALRFLGDGVRPVYFFDMIWSSNLLYLGRCSVVDEYSIEAEV